MKLKKNDTIFSSKKVLTLCAILVHLLIFSQRPKQKLLSHYIWQYPTLTITETKLCLIIDETPFPVPVYMGETMVSSNLITSENTISNDILKYLDFRTFKLTDLNDADVYLKIIPLPSIIKIKSELKNESKVKLLNEPPAYDGKLDYEFGVKTILTNKKDEVLFEKEYLKTFNLYEVSSHNNFQIKSAELALDLVRKLFEKNSTNFIKEAFSKSNSYIMYNVTSDILSNIDFQRIKEHMPFYTFNSKKDKNLNLNNDFIYEIEKELKELNDSPQYQTKVKKILEPKIKAWESMLLNYNKSEEKKIYWGISANMSISYFMIGEYLKALNLYYELNDIEYRENYNYLEEFPKEALESNNISSYKDFQSLDYSGTHNPDLILYTNADGIVENRVSEIEIQKATLMYQIFSIHEYYRQVKRYTKLFAIESTSTGYGYEEVDDYFLSLNQRVTNEAEFLKTFDFKGFSKDEKSLCTLVIHDLSELVELYNDELKAPLNIENNTKSSTQTIDEVFKIKKILIYKLGNYLKEKEKELEKNIEVLAKKLLFNNNEVLMQLSFLDMLIDELTTEGKLNYNDNPDLYRTLYEDYKKIYKSIIINKEHLIKHLHHTQSSKVEDIINLYYNKVYQKDINRVNEELKNIHMPKYSIDLLAIYIND